MEKCCTKQKLKDVHTAELEQLRLSKITVGFRLGESHAPVPFNPSWRAVSLALSHDILRSRCRA